MMLVDQFPWLLQPTLPTMILRMVMVFLCAGAIGFKRDESGAQAGFRTHILVCLGAMLTMSTGQFAYLYMGSSVEPTRIGAQVVSGIGFLGAGTIIVNRRNNHISGLTTAAGLWASACIGLAIGIGFYEGAVVGTVAVYFTEQTLRKWSKERIQSRKNQRANETQSSMDSTTLSDDEMNDVVESEEE